MSGRDRTIRCPWCQELHKVRDKGHFAEHGKKISSWRCHVCDKLVASDRGYDLRDHVRRVHREADPEKIVPVWSSADQPRDPRPPTRKAKVDSKSRIPSTSAAPTATPSARDPVATTSRDDVSLHAPSSSFLGDSLFKDICIGPTVRLSPLPGSRQSTPIPTCTVSEKVVSRSPVRPPRDPSMASPRRSSRAKKHPSGHKGSGQRHTHKARKRTVSDSAATVPPPAALDDTVDRDISMRYFRSLSLSQQHTFLLECGYGVPTIDQGGQTRGLWRTDIHACTDHASTQTSVATNSSAAVQTEGRTGADRRVHLAFSLILPDGVDMDAPSMNILRNRGVDPDTE